MQNCIKCKAELADDYKWCPYCGRKRVREKSAKSRGNGQGTVYKLPNGKYAAVVTIGYKRASDNSKKRVTRSKQFVTKREAMDYLPLLRNQSATVQAPKTPVECRMTFKELYDKWYPTHNASKSTMGNYSAAFKHFFPLWEIDVKDISIDDLQECLSEIPGKRTQQNAKATIGLMYKYGIPRGYTGSSLLMSDYLKITADDKSSPRESFSLEQIEAIKNNMYSVPNGEYIYCLIYLGLRPSEFLSVKMEQYDRNRQYIIGGSKTDAGRDRTVTLSPKIQKMVESIADRNANSEYLFCDTSGDKYELKRFTKEVFYTALDAAGIKNPIVEGNDNRHKYTPHTCRHTFATLVKYASEKARLADKDILQLIGHTDMDMLRYYQDVSIDDLKKITDII